MTYWISILITVLVIYIAISVALYYLQDYLLFKPEKLPDDFQFHYKNQDIEEHNLKTRDGALNIFPTYKFIKEVTCPITIFHGTKDQVVPYSSAEKLIKEVPKENIMFITINGASHNNIIEFDAYHNTIKNILP